MAETQKKVSGKKFTEYPGLTSFVDLFLLLLSIVHIFESFYVKRLRLATLGLLAVSRASESPYNGVNKLCDKEMQIGKYSKLPFPQFIVAVEACPSPGKTGVGWYGSRKLHFVVD